MSADTIDIPCLGGSADGRIIQQRRRNPSAYIDFPVRVRYSLDRPGNDFVADRYELKRTHDGRAFYVHPDYKGGPPPAQ